MKTIIRFNALFLGIMLLCLNKTFPQLEPVKLPDSDFKVQPYKILPTNLTNWDKSTPVKFIIKPDDEGNMDFDTMLAFNLQQKIEDIHTSYEIPGISAAVYVPGKGMWLGVTGYSTLDPLDSISHDMLFSIISCTKPFISSIILMLAEEEKLSLDDSIGIYLPDLPENISGKITIRELLDMKSGLWEYYHDGGHDAIFEDLNRYWTTEDILTELVGPPIKPPGTYHYCNTNLLLAGLIIRNIMQTNVSTQLHERIFEPVNLERTFYGPEDTLVGPIAHPWSNGADTWDIVSTNAWISMAAETAGIYSTAEDLALFANALFTGQLFSQEWLEQIQTEQYSLCIRAHTILGKNFFGHNGHFMDGYQSNFYYNPSSGLIISELHNNEVSPTGEIILHYVLNEYLKAIPISSVAEPEVFYALSSTGNVYISETSSLALNDIGKVMFPGIRKMKMHPGTGELWGIARNYIGQQIVKFNCNTGEAFPRIEISNSGDNRFTGMEFSSDGTLYIASNDGEIYSVDTASGIATLSASIQIPVSALAIHPGSGEFWVSAALNGKDRIFKFSLQDGDTLGLGNTGSDQKLNDIAFDSQGKLFGILQGIDSLPSRLVYIDQETGKVTRLKSYNNENIKSFAFTTDALMSPVPNITMGNPSLFELGQNYPNPVIHSTTIDYRIEVREHVSLKIYNLNGQEIATLVNEEVAPGSYSVTWNSNNFPSGVYYYSMEVGSFIESRKLLLIKER